MNKISITTVSLLALAATAFAGAGDKTKDTTKTTTKTTTTSTTTTTTASTDSMQMPMPSQALTDMAKKMKGSYSCKGTMTNPDGATQTPVTAKIKWSLDLDKMWIRGDMSMPKMKGMKKGYKATFLRTESNGTWYHLTYDNMGGWGHSTSSGPDADGKTTFDGESTMMGQSIKVHDYEQAGEKKNSMHVWGEVSMDGAKWAPAYDLTCSK
jgi:hypothetical protein